MALLIPPGFLQALYLAAVFMLILGIKDLVIVNRRAAYQFLVFLLSFAGCLLFFEHFAAWSVTASFLSLALTSLLWLWLVRSDPEHPEAPLLPSALAALAFFEIGSALFFLPLSFFSQAGLLFFGSALLFEAATDLESLAPKQIYAWSGGYATLALLVALLTSWKV